jgi:hypothetical protein
VVLAQPVLHIAEEVEVVQVPQVLKVTRREQVMAVLD